MSPRRGYACVKRSATLPLDCVLEVKDKERSLLRARELLAGGVRA